MPSPLKPPSTPSPDPLATPFDTHREVDLLLQDLQPPPAKRPERGSRRAVRETPSGGGRPVLVVDTTPIARKFLLQRLQSLGYDVQTAEDGERAVAMIAQQRFAIVFIELAMGPASSVDGLGLCQAVKKQVVDGNAPAVVITTGQTDSSSRVRGTLAGCDAFLSKPLIEGEFLAALRSVDPLFL